jgi:hypothetical protein
MVRGKIEEAFSIGNQLMLVFVEEEAGHEKEREQ